jgi:DNA-binding MarR family transcriptional regulator
MPTAPLSWAPTDCGTVAMKKLPYQEICHPAHPEFRLETSPFYLMAHADFDYHEDMGKVLAKHGVDRSIYRIMTVLREQQPANIGLLAERSLMKRNTASRVIERMAERGLVSTKENSSDSRVTDVSLTQRGRDLLNLLTPIVGRQFQRAVAGLGEEGLEQLVALLQKVCRNLTRSPIETLEDAPTLTRRESLGRLPAGQVWAASPSGSAGVPALARIEVTRGKGQGVRSVGDGSPALRGGLRAARDYFHKHARKLLGDRDIKGKELVPKIYPVNGSEVDASFSLSVLLALCSAVLEKPLRTGLLVVGELPGEGVESLQRPIDFIDVAVEQGARAILLPVSCRRAAAGISDAVATQLEFVFFTDARDALNKALQD